MTKKSYITGLIIASVMGGLVSLGGYKLSEKNNKKYESIIDRQNVLFTNHSPSPGGIVPTGLNFIQAAEISRSAVVHIKTHYEASGNYYYYNPIDYLFRDFFGDQYNNKKPHENYPRIGSGSGVIITDDGYIVTNNHVIKGGEKIEIILDDKRTYIAEVIGTDPSTDLALIKIDEKGLPFLKYGNSEDTKVGEWVLAVGNPFNLTSTVTAGIVSAKGRNLGLLRDANGMQIESFIQTDAAVNPGNSGGALVDLNGELIGINTAIQTPTNVYIGYSFAVPVSLVKKVVDDLLKYGEVQRALLGVRIMNITSDLAKEYGIDQLKGVYIADVNTKSAAQKAGIKAGDIILEVNDVEVNSTSELQEQVAKYRPGDMIEVKYLRNNKAKSVWLSLKNKLGNTEIVKKQEKIITVLGADFQEVSKKVKEKLKIKGGIEIIELRNGKLKSVGIQEGFIITHIDKIRVYKPDDIKEILKNIKGGILIQGIYPNGAKGYYAIGM
ncbi:MAG: Do family serine endopeptidase [Cytophagales bacterium]|nr:Do family serine endopeptidase [Cytophagales bacterium]